MKTYKRVISVIMALALITALFVGVTVTASADTEERNIIRIAGSNRYDTSILAADALKKEMNVIKFSCVVLASGEKYPDALAGSYLAIKKKAPILLVNDGAMKKVTDYIKANLKSDGIVYVLGGEGAVSKKAEEALAEDFTVTRLAGSDRFETNMEILKEAGYLGGSILVCTGTDYADSLSVSSTGMPILLVGKTLTESQKKFLKDKMYCYFHLIGGTGAVSEEVVAELLQIAPVERVAGDNRFETSVAVAKRFFYAVNYGTTTGKWGAMVRDPETIALVYAQNFPDGLSAGPLAAAMNAPVILVQNANKAVEVASEYRELLELSTMYVMGGETLISEETANTIFDNGTIIPPTPKSTVIELPVVPVP